MTGTCRMKYLMDFTNDSTFLREDGSILIAFLTRQTRGHQCACVKDAFTPPIAKEPEIDRQRQRVAKMIRKFTLSDGSNPNLYQIDIYSPDFDVYVQTIT